MHIMLDIETMATTPRAAIASIGLVAFDPAVQSTVEELRNRSKLIVVDLSAQPAREFNGDTIYFWLRQPDEARRALYDSRYSGMLHPFAALEVIRDFKVNAGDGLWWAWPAAFDFPIMENLYQDFRRPAPWKYSDVRCARTLAKVLGVERPQVEGLVLHNPVDDCIQQAMAVQKCLDLASYIAQDDEVLELTDKKGE